MSNFFAENERAKLLAHQALAAMQEIEEIKFKQSESTKLIAAEAAKKAGASEKLFKRQKDGAQNSEAGRAAKRQRTNADQLTKEAIEADLIASKARAAVKAVRETSILMDACKGDDLFSNIYLF